MSIAACFSILSSKEPPTVPPILGISVVKSNLMLLVWVIVVLDL
ncbi:hypothetical protein ACT7C8_01265 [Bacillus cereus]